MNNKILTLSTFFQMLGPTRQPEGQSHPLRNSTSKDHDVANQTALNPSAPLATQTCYDSRHALLRPKRAIPSLSAPDRQRQQTAPGG